MGRERGGKRKRSRRGPRKEGGGVDRYLEEDEEVRRKRERGRGKWSGWRRRVRGRKKRTGGRGGRRDGVLGD
ncbi:hypothetical protein PoB_000566300 [Plakobranchus ocellatus]|uniref:Uncharacterized protein n=1 Tax=Plakobranchus ocellatus TaxID=259542 RepID=A0AAV3Y9I3_9GAST|nr:hypothetical protein PoB_000566300 [Plakobranchus ocellatus]